MFSRSVAKSTIDRAACFLGRSRRVNRILHILYRVINTLTGPLGRPFLHTPCEERDRSDHANGEDESGHHSSLHRELLSVALRRSLHTQNLCQAEDLTEFRYFAVILPLGLVPSFCLDCAAHRYMHCAGDADRGASTVSIRFTKRLPRSLCVPELVVRIARDGTACGYTQRRDRFLCKRSTLP